jgi:hypothetical protein
MAKTMYNTVGHYCFITGGGTFYHDEQCVIEQRQIVGSVGWYWTLVAWSNQGGFSCRARCLASNETVSSQVYFGGKMVATSREMATVQSNYCFITLGGGWDRQSNNYCRISTGYIAGSDALYWILYASGEHSYFQCGARCVNLPKYSTLNLSAGSLVGTGSQQYAMVPSNSSYCFVTYGRSWYKNDESCWITNTLIKGSSDYWWVLNAKSAVSSFVCGASCVTYR